MNNQQKWFDLLPLYIEGQLSSSDTREMEYRLAHDPALQAAYVEWQTIAGTVREEAALWAAKLPPLSAKVKAQLGVSQSTQPNLAPPVEPTRVMQMPTRQIAQPQSSDGYEPTYAGLGYREPRIDKTGSTLRRFPFSAAAAAIILLFLSVFLIYLATGTTDDPESLTRSGQANKQPITPTVTAFVINATALLTNTLPPTPTPDVATATRTPRPPVDPGVSAFDTTAAVPEASGLGGGGADSTGILSTGPQAAPIEPYTMCTATAQPGLPVSVYVQPNSGETILRQIWQGENWNVIAVTPDGYWYEVVSTFEPYERGWAYGPEIILSGDCSVLQQPSATPTADVNMPQCIATSIAGGTPFNVYSGPGVNYPVTNTFYNAEVVAYSDNGWVRVVSAVAGGYITYGWVSQTTVNISGEGCIQLPTLPALNITPDLNNSGQ